MTGNRNIGGTSPLPTRGRRNHSLYDEKPPGYADGETSPGKPVPGTFHPAAHADREQKKNIFIKRLGHALFTLLYTALTRIRIRMRINNTQPAARYPVQCGHQLGQQPQRQQAGHRQQPQHSGPYCRRVGSSYAEGIIRVIWGLRNVVTDRDARLTPDMLGCPMDLPVPASQPAEKLGLPFEMSRPDGRLLDMLGCPAAVTSFWLKTLASSSISSALMPSASLSSICPQVKREKRGGYKLRDLHAATDQAKGALVTQFYNVSTTNSLLRFLVFFRVSGSACVSGVSRVSCAGSIPSR